MSASEKSEAYLGGTRGGTGGEGGRRNGGGAIPCLACTVHAVNAGQKPLRWRRVSLQHPSDAPYLLRLPDFECDLRKCTLKHIRLSCKEDVKEGQPVLRQRMTGTFHRTSGQTILPHLIKQAEKLSGIRGGVSGREILFAGPIFDSGKKPAVHPAILQYRVEQICAGGFAVGSGNSIKFHRVIRQIVKCFIQI